MTTFSNLEEFTNELINNFNELITFIDNKMFKLSYDSEYCEYVFTLNGEFVADTMDDNLALSFWNNKVK